MRLSNSDDFDAIVLFVQQGVAEISDQNVSIKQAMNIYLVEPEDLNASIMEATVFMNFQLRKKSTYSKAAKEFLTVLQANAIANMER